MGFRVCPPHRMPREAAEKLLAEMDLFGFTWKENKHLDWTSRKYYFLFSSRTRVYRTDAGERVEYVPSMLITEEKRRAFVERDWLVVDTVAFEKPGFFPG